MTDLSTAFARLVATLGDATKLSFRPGQSDTDVRRALGAAGVTDITDEAVEWFTLQDGLIEQHEGRLFFDFDPPPLDELLDEWSAFLAQTERLEVDHGPDIRHLDYWPKPGWFPLDSGQGRFVIETQHPDEPGRVVRAWEDQLEIYAPSLLVFLGIGAAAQVDGPTPITLQFGDETQTGAMWETPDTFRTGEH